MFDPDFAPVTATSAPPVRVVRANEPATPPPPGPSKREITLNMIRQIIQEWAAAEKPIHVHPAPVTVQAAPPAPAVNIDPPTVNVAAPTVNVAAPAVTIQQPERRPRTIRFEVERDAAGRIQYLTATEL